MSRRGAGGQVLVALAFLVPLVLLPVVAYAAGSAVVASRQEALQAALAQAAEDSVQSLDEDRFRLDGTVVIDSRSAPARAAAALAADAPGAMLDGIEVSGATMTLSAHEVVTLELGGFMGVGHVTIRAAAKAALVAGYGRPSRRMPLP
ncbi:MAG: hypothetical protein NVS9B1_17350 [Candidatus Dormibacteraceae bacterium]